MAPAPIAGLDIDPDQGAAGAIERVHAPAGVGARQRHRRVGVDHRRRQGLALQQTSEHDLAWQLGASCLVIGNVYHSFLVKLYLELVGSKTERLVTRTSCDVIFVKAEHYEAELGRHVDLDAVCHEHGVTWRKAA